MQGYKISRFVFVYYQETHRVQKITPTVKSTVKYWIIKHPCVIVSTITNGCVKVNITGKNENQSVPKLFLQIYVRELHKNMVRPVSQGEL